MKWTPFAFAFTVNARWNKRDALGRWTKGDGEGSGEGKEKKMDGKPTTGPSGIEEAIVAFVNRWAEKKTVGCQFNVMWEEMKKTHPQMTIGTFQDALRKLSEAGRVRLGGWPRMLDDMPQPQLAFFVSSKVMYYAHPGEVKGHEVKPVPAKDDWLEQVVSRVDEFTRRHPSASYPLPELYKKVVEPLGVSVGEYHEGLRRLSREGRVRLVEWTQPLRTMPDDRFALIAGGEIRYYVRSR